MPPLPAPLPVALARCAGSRMPHGSREGFLETIHRHTMLTSTVPDNGDQNPYAIVVAPVSAGKIQKDDVLVDNFNDTQQPAGPRHHDRRLPPGDAGSSPCSPASRATCRNAPAASG